MGHLCLTAAAKPLEIRRPQLKQPLDTHTRTNTAEMHVALEMKMIICHFERHRNKRGHGRKGCNLKMHSFCYTGCGNATELTLWHLHLLFCNSRLKSYAMGMVHCELLEESMLFSLCCCFCFSSLHESLPFYWLAISTEHYCSHS